jgi:hypothetical protein
MKEALPRISRNPPLARVQTRNPKEIQKAEISKTQNLQRASEGFASFFLDRTQNGCKFMNREIREIREKTPFELFAYFAYFAVFPLPSLVLARPD